MASPSKNGEAENGLSGLSLCGDGNAARTSRTGFLGIKAGDSRHRVPFPDDYVSNELAGKNAEFKVVVHKVEEQSAAGNR